MAMFEGLLDWSDGIGLGFASSLLQLHLMVGLLFWFLGTVLNSSSETSFVKLRASQWQATLNGASVASGPARLVAVFALIQARGGATDMVTFVGLSMIVATVSLLTLIVVLIPGFGCEVPDLDANSGDVKATESKTAGMMCKALSAIRSIGQLILVFAVPPEGFQLVCASVLVRTAFLISAVGSLSRTMGFASEAREDAERVVGGVLAPMIGTLALLDHMAWGSSSMLFAPMQPVVYCTMFAMMQAGLVFTAHMLLNGRVEETEHSGSAEIDFKFELGDEYETDGAGARLETMRQLMVAGLFAALAAGVGRVSAGVFGIAFSMKGVCLNWGEPAAGMAVIMCALNFAVMCAQYLFAGTETAVAKKSQAGEEAATGEEGEAVASAEANGVEHDNGAASKGHENGTASPGTLYFLKLLMVPCTTLIIALVCAHTAIAANPPREDWDGAEPMELAFEFAKMPVRYGFVLASVAVIMQVKILALYTLWNKDTKQPPFDCTGTIQWGDVGSPSAGKALGVLRWTTLVLLMAGTLLGCVGFGALLMGAVFVIVGSISFIILPSESKQVLVEVLSIFFACFGSIFSGVFSAAEAYMIKKRLEKEAAAAEHAAKKAAELEEEIPDKEQKAAKDAARPAGQPKAATSAQANAKKKAKAPGSAGKKKKN